ncbi:MAG: hypothetical protein HOP17_02865 [Acidobacteria bacterium]|nr:hypothetical protein [Acidobacteriota bacterium]
MDTLSSEERADALIALSIVFDRRSPQRNGAAPERPVSEVVDESLRSLNSLRRAKIDRRAAQIDSFTEPRRQRWLGRWIDNIRRRGRSTKLDQNVNAEQIAAILKTEPHAIRRSILSYIPPDLGRDVERLLEPDLDANSIDNELSNDLSPEILDVIKGRFLANFVQIESVGDANAIDEFAVEDLWRFVRALGLREIAVACRGIRSKEKIAAFLCRFAEDDAKTIAVYLSNLDHVEPVWVSLADRTVKRLWNRRLRPHLILYKIGLELLACAFAERSDTAVRYTAQKLSYRDSRRWKRIVLGWRAQLNDPDTRMVEIERQRAEMIVRMAGKFRATASL